MTGGNGHLGTDSPHALRLGAAFLEHIRPKNRVAPGTIVEIGQQHIIANRAEAAATSLSSSRMPGASISKNTAGNGPSRSGRQINVSI
jgi:hypothetical protein